MLKTFIPITLLICSGYLSADISASTPRLGTDSYCFGFSATKSDKSEIYYTALQKRREFGESTARAELQSLANLMDQRQPGVWSWIHTAELRCLDLVDHFFCSRWIYEILEDATTIEQKQSALCYISEQEASKALEYMKSNIPGLIPIE